VLSRELGDLEERGSLKGAETVITGVKAAEGDKGPRYFVQGYGDKEFLRVNSNSYLGMPLRPELMEAEEKGAREFGVGPGAVRFISGTYKPHVELEEKLAKFHGREAAMIFSSAYATVVGILSPLISKDTIVVSDELNHNCIINAIRLSRPKDKKVYRHNNMAELESAIKESVGNCSRLIVVTDGIFSMRGDYAPLREIAGLAARYDPEFEEGILTVVDDSHGVGAIGETGRGTTEHTHENRVDILVSTLGKALGTNGGYLVSDATVVQYLRETAPFYIYSLQCVFILVSIVRCRFLSGVSGSHSGSCGLTTSVGEDLPRLFDWWVMKPRHKLPHAVLQEEVAAVGGAAGAAERRRQCEAWQRSPCERISSQARATFSGPGMLSPDSRYSLSSISYLTSP